MTHIDWLGRQHCTEDVIEPELVRRLAATLSDNAPQEGEALPPLWHWAFFQPHLVGADIGEDGHPARGVFFPPVKNYNRMWAGGRFIFHFPLTIGEKVQRVTTIRNIEKKQGRTGDLLFVTFEHNYQQNGESAFIEEQNLVYRAPSKPKFGSGEACPLAQWAETIQPDGVLLFRYSAVTFNSHRIHYDYPYATEVEGYPGLVVQGQLIATLSLRAFCRANPEKQMLSYAYRSQRPLFSGQSFQVAGNIIEPGKAHVWAGNETGIAQSGIVQF